MRDSTSTSAQAHISSVVVGFALVDDALQVGVVKRELAPLKGRLELPGDFVAPDKISTAASDLTRSALGISRSPQQLQTYDAVRRDPRGTVVTVAWWALLRPDEAAQASVQWLAVDDVDSARMAFDQAKIVVDAVTAVQDALRFTSVATQLCDETFTMTQLRRVYEVLWGQPIDPANFHRKVTGNPSFVQSTSHVSQGGPGRPAQLYQAGGTLELALPMSRAPQRRGA